MLSIKIKKNPGDSTGTHSRKAIDAVRVASEDISSSSDVPDGHFILDVEFAPPGVTILFGASGSGRTMTLKCGSPSKPIPVTCLMNRTVARDWDQWSVDSSFIILRL